MTTTQSRAPIVELPAILDLAVAADLKAQLQAALQAGAGVEVMGARVERVSSLCLQILASAARSFVEAGGAAFGISSASAPLAETAAMLGLTDTLGL